MSLKDEHYKNLEEDLARMHRRFRKHWSLGLGFDDFRCKELEQKVELREEDIRKELKDHVENLIECFFCERDLEIGLIIERDGEFEDKLMSIRMAFNEMIFFALYHAHLSDPECEDNDHC